MDLQKCVVQFGELFPQIPKQGRAKWNLRVWGLVVYLGKLVQEVQDVFAEMRGVIWRAVPAKVKHVRWNLGDWGFDGVSLVISGRYFRIGLQKCVVQFGELFPQIPKQGCARSNLRVWGLVVYLGMLVDFGNSSPYYTAHFGKHIRNQRPRVHHKTSDPKISSYASRFSDLWEQLPKLHHAFLQTHPKITSRDTPSNLRP